MGERSGECLLEAWDRACGSWIEAVGMGTDDGEEEENDIAFSGNLGIGDASIVIHLEVFA